MLDNVGTYFYTSSIIHKLNPISKIILALLLILSILISFNLYHILFLTIFVIIIMVLAKVPIVLYYKTNRKLIILILSITLLTLILTVSINITFMIFMKLILILLTASILIKTTSLTEILYGLEKILKPFEKWKVKPRKDSIKIIMNLKFICDFINDFSFKNIKKTYKRTKRKQKTLKAVMKIRMFNQSRGRTCYRADKLKITDIILITCYSVILMIILVKGAFI